MLFTWKVFGANIANVARKYMNLHDTLVAHRKSAFTHRVGVCDEIR